MQNKHSLAVESHSKSALFYMFRNCGIYHCKYAKVALFYRRGH